MRRWSITVLVACALAAVLAAGCARQPASQDVRVSAADNGKTKALASGQTLVVELSANPSTGYTWVVDGELPPQLRQLAEPTYTSTNTGVVGGGGTQSFRFESMAAGVGTLKMKYWRSFEPTTPPAETFALTVDVH